MLPEIIFKCVDIKRQVVENDQFDTGERMLLNFGHTLAHTFNSISITNGKAMERLLPSECTKSATSQRKTTTDGS